MWLNNHHVTLPALALDLGIMPTARRKNAEEKEGAGKLFKQSDLQQQKQSGDQKPQ
jgi:hypothetical protein